jgi:hypothetical protein
MKTMIMQVANACVLAGAGAVVALAQPVAVQAQSYECTRCVDDFQHGIHEVVFDITVLLGTGDEPHDWLGGSCTFHLHFHTYSCQSLPDETDTVLELVSARDDNRRDQVLALANARPDLFIVNLERNKIQLLGCDGVSVVRQFSLPDRSAPPVYQRADGPR